MHTSLPTALRPQIAQAVSIIEHHLRDSLVAVHLFGSALQGGLKPSSDIDLLVVVEEQLRDDIRDSLMVGLLTASAPPGANEAVRPLEVTVVARTSITPWRHPVRRELQFGEWLREDIEAGRFEGSIADPDLTILLSKVLLHGASLVGPEPSEILGPVPTSDVMQALLETAAQWNVPEDWAGEERNIVLALARMWFTASTGAIASKDDAAHWLIERLPEEHRMVVSSAAAAYRGEADDRLADHPAEVSAFIHYARAAVVKMAESRAVQVAADLRS
ncbi:MAG: DUF4111 domain-containing protein [Sphingomonas sp.]|nr:DUF4111 domain-containing protein [Sphingomonas sp.]